MYAVSQLCNVFLADISDQLLWAQSDCWQNKDRSVVIEVEGAWDKTSYQIPTCHQPFWQHMKFGCKAERFYLLMILDHTLQNCEEKKFQDQRREQVDLIDLLQTLSIWYKIRWVQNHLKVQMASVLEHKSFYCVHYSLCWARIWLSSSLSQRGLIRQTDSHAVLLYKHEHVLKGTLA